MSPGPYLELFARRQRLGWDALHPRLGLTRRFYDWFTPAIAASDFALRVARPRELDRALDFLAVCRG